VISQGFSLLPTVIRATSIMDPVATNGTSESTAPEVLQDRSLLRTNCRGHCSAPNIQNRHPSSIKDDVKAIFKLFKLF